MDPKKSIMFQVVIAPAKGTVEKLELTGCHSDGSTLLTVPALRPETQCRRKRSRRERSEESPCKSKRFFGRGVYPASGGAPSE